MLRGVKLVADVNVKDVAGRKRAERLGPIAVPGGMPGAERIADHIKFDAVLKKHFMAGKLMAAICAAPATVSNPRVPGGGIRATAHPARSWTSSAGRCSKNIYADSRVVVGKTVVTSCGRDGAGVGALPGGAAVRAGAMQKDRGADGGAAGERANPGEAGGRLDEAPCPQVSDTTREGESVTLDISDKVMKHETRDNRRHRKASARLATFDRFVARAQLVGHLFSAIFQNTTSHYSLRVRSETCHTDQARAQNRWPGWPRRP